MHIQRNYTKYAIIICFIFYVYCSDVIVFEVELEEEHIDQRIVVIKQRIDRINSHLVILHVFFEENKGDTLLEFILEFLSGVDILGFN